MRKSGKTAWAIGRFGAIAVIAALASGCPRQPDTVGPQPIGPAAAPKRDHLSLAMDYLQRLDEFDPEKGIVQTAYYLNRWMERCEQDVAWKPSPMIDGLPSRVRQIRPLAELGKRQVTTDDVRFLREALWMHSISERASQETMDEPAFADWLDRIEQARGEPHAYEVALAARLFDWTVRNIQLDQLLAYPAPAAGPAAGAEKDATQPVWPLQRAAPGPGYTTYPWQTLLFGRGDAWQRARVFILLARQQQIDVVMLALDDPRQVPRPRPWLPAAVIDDQLYLFDTALGLPIPGPGGRGIATFEQVRRDRSLLRGLDVGSAYRYAAAEADLDRVVALIDASPSALSLRMRLIESQATSGPRLALTIDPAELAERLRRCEGISDVRLWPVPCETWIYRAALRRRMEEDAPLLRRLILDELIFEGMHPMVQGRRLHLRGKFENEGQKQGAVAYYLNARVPNALIEQIATSPDVQQSLGIVRQRENDLEWQTKLQNQKQIAVRIKQNCSFWLGLIHFETGRYDAARDWLKLRVLEANENGPWTGGARYNLARVYEALGELEEARQQLLLDDSPQKHGNLLRARLLRKKLEARDGSGEDVDHAKPDE